MRILKEKKYLILVKECVIVNLPLESTADLTITRLGLMKE